MSALQRPALECAMPRAVICDMDGLLLDSERLDRRLWREVARRRGLDLPDKVHAALIGYCEEDCLARLEAFFGSELDVRAMQAEVDAAWMSEVHGPGIPLKAGVARLFDFLDAHSLPRALATSSSRAKTTLCLGPLVKRFDVIVCGDEVPSGKPALDHVVASLAAMITGAQRIEHENTGE
jgi:beta-phosphoglucomutase-like phosphatase (HAD superfamily)